MSGAAGKLSLKKARDVLSGALSKFKLGGKHADGLPLKEGAPKGRIGLFFDAVGGRLAAAAPGLFPPSLLTRYLFRQNMFFVVMSMLAGTAVYLLIDLFDHVDEFVSAGVSLKIIILYFVSKIPLIISQILPATFLLSTLVQLCLMAKNREYMAMQAGGISPLRLVLVIFSLGILWGSVQLVFSQAVGVQGDRYAIELWREHVEGKADKSQIVRKLWFWNENRAIYLDVVNLQTGQAQDASIYVLSEDGSAVKEVIRAPRVVMQDKRWRLYNATVYNTDGYIQAVHREVDFPIEQQLKVLTALSETAQLEGLSLWQLGDMIKRLKEGGSNLESLRTLWHSKLAYAAAVAVMALIAVALMLWRDNVYIDAAVSLVVVFVFYSLFTVGITAGQKGLLSPAIATWGGPVGIGLLAWLYIFWRIRPPWVRRAKQRALEWGLRLKNRSQGGSRSE